MWNPEAKPASQREGTLECNLECNYADNYYGDQVCVLKTSGA
ncbi:hypothetical protein [Microbulbifer salipaludis]|nr:hypothetical protein [Microbulbifer salipaludis]